MDLVLSSLVQLPINIEVTTYKELSYFKRFKEKLLRRRTEPIRVTTEITSVGDRVKSIEGMTSH